MANATLTSSADAAAMDHRNLELLLMVVMMMTHSLLRNKGAAADDCAITTDEGDGEGIEHGD